MANRVCEMEGKSARIMLSWPRAEESEAWKEGSSLIAPASRFGAAELPPLCSVNTKPTPTRVLVVDDNTGLVEAISTALSLAGFCVAGVSTTAQAIESLEDSAPQVLVTDVDMPGGGAHSILGSIEGRRRRPAVVLMTGSEFVWAAEAVATGKAHAAIAKPFRLRSLIDIISGIDTLLASRGERRGGSRTAHVERI
ncbi:MAG: response regulator [Acidobacteria bacterium]|nr:response regulator [Acidobacteriota bacterium]